jgi:hypothetical protein
MAIIDNRGRKSATILTERDCTKRVTQRTKLYDKKCRGLYVSIIPAGVATFSFKFTDKATHKQRSRLLGIHSPAFTVEDARTVVYALRNRMGQGENIAQTQRQDNELKAKQGVTVDQIIAERVEWMKTRVLKRDGEMRPPNREVGQRRKAPTALHQPPVGQEGRQRGYQQRHRAIVG